MLYSTDSITDNRLLRDAHAVNYFECSWINVLFNVLECYESSMVGFACIYKSHFDFWNSITSKILEWFLKEYVETIQCRRNSVCLVRRKNPFNFQTLKYRWHECEVKLNTTLQIPESTKIFFHQPRVLSFWM